ncbi:MAG: hypothetical protein FWG87_03290 [Defluviitaleaceae bacterium]|nr:hypothetical protein [Defluviitaleaceae bacterium]
MSAPRFARSSIRGRTTSINAERGNLRTDKSVPYKNRAILPFTRLAWCFAIRVFGVTVTVGGGQAGSKVLSKWFS